MSEPDFLERTKPDANRLPIRSRNRWMVGAALAASSLLFAVPEASGSVQKPVAIVAAEGTYAVPEIAEWRQWLRGLGEKDLDPAVLRSLRLSFEKLIEPTGLLPGGMATPEGAYLLTWDFEEHHLELELFPDHWDWFYKNRETGRLAGEEDLVVVDFSRFRRLLMKYAS